MKENKDGNKGVKVGRRHFPTVRQLVTDRVGVIARDNWAPTLEKFPPFNPKVVQNIYYEELQGYEKTSQIMFLEFSQYLENYLWPNFNALTASKEHILSIAMMVNEKWRERNPAWSVFVSAPGQFEGFFQSVLNFSLAESSKVNMKEKSILLVFLMHCMNSIEIDLIRSQVQKLLSLASWQGLLPGRLSEELERNPKLKKLWKVLTKNDKKMDEESLKQAMKERLFMKHLMDHFIGVVESMEQEAEIDVDKRKYCERFLEFLIDMEVILPTRRFFNTLLDSEQIVVRLEISKLNGHPDCSLFSEMLQYLKYYSRFEIDDHSGNPLTQKEMLSRHYKRVTDLQRSVFKLYPELKKFCVSSVSRVDSRDMLMKHFKPLNSKKLHQISALLNMVDHLSEGCCKSPYEKKVLLEMIISRHERTLTQLQRINNMPLYPTEDLLWDENVIPMSFYDGKHCLALPKLNLQFLTLHDYLLRNFHLFRLEAAYEIREEIEDVVSRLKPWQTEDKETSFGGWARFGMPITKFTRFEVSQPRLGEMHPAKVSAHVSVTLSMRPDLKEEWENMRRFDTGFLLTLRPTEDPLMSSDADADFQTKYGVVYVRGIEFEGKLDEEGKLIEDFPDQPPKFNGDQRTFRVLLDPCQYQIDMESHESGLEDVYETFNVIFRRSPKVNNFKAVLETIRDLMNSEFNVPDWLHDIILGYGDPASAHYSNMSMKTPTLDWNDTFIDFRHLLHSFPGCNIETSTKDEKLLVPPFRITFQDAQEDSPVTLTVEPHVIPNRGPYPVDEPKKNCIRFTPTQIEAIKSGMNPGLTMIVGPPGTGKTDVAVQIISNLYHNFPQQRTLIVTHSNMALNQLFEKIIALDIDERHCLRLGHGEEALETEKDFSRYGRVNFVLAERIKLLKEVSRLQNSLGITGDVTYTCETAAHFFLHQVMSRWEQYWAKVSHLEAKLSDLINFFPFHGFFSTAPQPLFKQQTVEEDREIALGCWRHIKMIFTKLEEYRAFELLRTGSERSKYLLVKEAKIIAMTCTHAALKRRDLIDYGFQYDNVLMEEAAQILEIETFIPLMLQKEKDGHNRLKRWIMIGDHNQLPPTVKNMSFAKYSNMEQALFTRLIKLNVPNVTLDAQGRARASLAQLYSWRYDVLGNLPHVQQRPEFQKANAGFCFDFQAINVADLNGIGETEPAPHFFQNLAEAEFVVATYIYMRLIGYPAEKITILTQYNGQRMLLNDVIQRKCAQNPLIGPPHKVETVDKYQGQQNDYILLSLTRTRSVGHLRDVRRLVVAMSRARLGLYVFARVDLFRDCIELSPAFVRFIQRPLTLHLAPTEQFPTMRSNGEFPSNPIKITDVTQMCHFVHNMYEQKRRFFEHQFQQQQQAQQMISSTSDTQEAPMETSQQESDVVAPVETGQPEDGGVAISFGETAPQADVEEGTVQVRFDASSLDQIAPVMPTPEVAMEEDLRLLNSYDDELKDSIEVKYNTDS